MRLKISSNNSSLKRLLRTKNRKLFGVHKKKTPNQAQKAAHKSSQFHQHPFVSVATREIHYIRAACKMMHSLFCVCKKIAAVYTSRESERVNHKHITGLDENIISTSLGRYI
jgi:hypothetical protein